MHYRWLEGIEAEVRSHSMRKFIDGWEFLLLTSTHTRAYASFLPVVKETFFCCPRVHSVWKVLVDILFADLTVAEE
jgi:hypothetical protein